MKTHTEKQFLKWAAAHEMGLDDRYPDCAVLTFTPNPHLDRFWETPLKPELRSYFLSLMLTLGDEWKSCFVWRHMGSWPTKPDPRRPNEGVEYQILSGLKLPMGTTQILEFDRSEMDRLVTLLFSTTVFAWSVGEDLYVIPDHAHQIMKTSHHDVVHVSFRNPKTMRVFVVGMAKEEFPLPDHLPDPTFKMPEWMKKPCEQGAEGDAVNRAP